MFVRCVALLAFVSAALASACGSLTADPTPVPGAAATLARSSRTPIPTPVRENSPAPPTVTALASPAPAASPSPVVASGAATPEDIAGIRTAMQRTFASPDLPNIERWLLDRVSLSTPAGGQVLERAEAARWLRDHAGQGIDVTAVDESSQTLMLEVQTRGWPIEDPLEQGTVTLSLRRYGPGGQPDDAGEWMIDVIGAE